MSTNERILSHATSARVLDRLFAGLRDDLATEEGRMRIAERYGGDTCARLGETLHALIGAPQPRHAYPAGPAGQGDSGSWTRR